MIASINQDSVLVGHLCLPMNQIAVLVGHLYLPIGYEEYVGTYSIIPKTTPQTVQTANKHLSNDINVDAIPYHAVGNESGGNTVTIG